MRHGVFTYTGRDYLRLRDEGPRQQPSLHGHVAKGSASCRNRREEPGEHPTKPVSLHDVSPPRFRQLHRGVTILSEIFLRMFPHDFGNCFQHLQVQQGEPDGGEQRTRSGAESAAVNGECKVTLAWQQKVTRFGLRRGLRESHGFAWLQAARGHEFEHLPLIPADRRAKRRGR